MSHFSKSYGTDRTTSALRVYRVALGLTQGDLADLAGVSRRTVNAIETGKWKPRQGTATSLATVLKCQVSDLFPGGIHGSQV